jgi:hypothetical protein
MDKALEHPGLGQVAGGDVVEDGRAEVGAEARKPHGELGAGPEGGELAAAQAEAQPPPRLGRHRAKREEMGIARLRRRDDRDAPFGDAAKAPPRQRRVGDIGGLGRAVGPEPAVPGEGRGEQVASHPLGVEPGVRGQPRLGGRGRGRELGGVARRDGLVAGQAGPGLGRLGGGGLGVGPRHQRPARTQQSRPRV